MEAPDVPLDDAQEHINHHAQHAHHEAPEKRWVLGVALSAAIFAALAAVASLLANDHDNDAMMSLIQASDEWNHYQAKGIKNAVLGLKVDLLTAEGKTPDPADQGKLKRYDDEQKAIQTKAEALKQESDANRLHGDTLSHAVTMFQVSIAVSAISVLVQRRAFWFVSLFFGAAGGFFLLRELANEFLFKH